VTATNGLAGHGLPGPTPVSVRVASRKDNVLLAELGARTFFDAFAEENDPDDMAAYLAEAFGPDIQAAELSEPGTTFLLAETAGTAVGYARLRRHPVPEAIPGTRRIELARLYADREWIGRGVGRALVEAALGIAMAERCDVIWLSTWDRNERGIAFYRRWGFEVVGEGDFLVGTDLQHDLLFARAVIQE
jgi:diamine N-acetyltransferase